MSFADELCVVLEDEERATVGPSFGGTGVSRSFSVVKIRTWILSQAPYTGQSATAACLRPLYEALPVPVFSKVVASLIRFSFLIELTDLKVGSTKMKTRWVPGLILMPQAGSFEPIRGSFEPGNDPRSSSFNECLRVFKVSCNIVREHMQSDPSVLTLLDDVGTWNRMPYEFLLGYHDPNANPVHRADNVCWLANDDIRWLVIARRILSQAPKPHRTAIGVIEAKKLEVKAYKTDRSLTGKDKTNRAKRWEVLSGDFQHATLVECWSVERKLTHDLVNFEEFPDVIKEEFLNNGLGFDITAAVTRCPVTLAPLNYPSFKASVLAALHGRSDYQVGHLNPLKRHGRHIGSNVCWQSADGNRIQGDLTIQETDALLDGIVARRLLLKPIDANVQ